MSLCNGKRKPTIGKNNFNQDEKEEHGVVAFSHYSNIPLFHYSIIPMNAWTIKALLDWMTPYLEDKHVDAPRLCAEMLMCHVLAKQRIELYTQFDTEVPRAELEALRSLVKRAAAHEPVAYLVGKTEFYSLELAVEPGCLIPRPETELLVQLAVEFLRASAGEPHVLDLGTGSGCIAVAIAKNCSKAHVTATDISQTALNIAKRNVQKHGLTHRITLAHGDLFSAISCGPFDLIVCNPPYVSEMEFDVLDTNVKAYEPQEALIAGPEGTEVYERILAEVSTHLKRDAALMFEIGYNQGSALQALLQASGLFSEVDIHKDVYGHDRVVVGLRTAHK